MKVVFPIASIIIHHLKKPSYVLEEVKEYLSLKSKSVLIYTITQIPVINVNRLKL